MSQRYTIVTGRDPQDLEAAVNRAMDEDLAWTPLGGVTVDQDLNHEYGETTIRSIYHQVLVKTPEHFYESE